MSLGYSKPFYILAFDHRSTLSKKLFGFSEELSDAQRQKMAEAKEIIFQGLLHALNLGLPKEYAALLVDEEFGATVLAEAQRRGITAIQTTEKSGLEEFDFEYGEDFGQHLKKYGANFAKALVRYNPAGDGVTNAHSREKLRILSDFCHGNGLKFLIEPLIAATAEELEELSGDKQQFDVRMRPELTVRMIKELQEAGVEPDIWKIEGMENPESYSRVVDQARSGTRGEVGIVVLGRGESRDKVAQWLQAGAGVPGVTGFAIGRTIFWDSLVKFKDGQITKEQAAEEIGQNYFDFYKIFAGV